MIPFLADASLHHAIVSGCRRREPAIDFLSALEADLEGVPDPDVLLFAAQRPDSGNLRPSNDAVCFGEFLLAHGHCPGIFLVKPRSLRYSLPRVLPVEPGELRPGEG